MGLKILVDEKKREVSPADRKGVLRWLFVCFLLVITCLVSEAKAQFLSDKPLIPTEESLLWIRGKTSVSTYTCQAQEVHGFGVLEDRSGQGTSEDAEAVVKVQVPVRALDCGKSAMNRDMYEALKADAHPKIHYELTRITLGLDDSSGKSFNPSGWLSVRAEGRLAIAGSTRTIIMKVRGKKKENGTVLVQGKKRLNMKQYGIDPPTALFGLVEVKDSLTVHYDLQAVSADTLPPDQLKQVLKARP